MKIKMTINRDNFGFIYFRFGYVDLIVNIDMTEHTLDTRLTPEETECCGIKFKRLKKIYSDIVMTNTKMVVDISLRYIVNRLGEDCKDEFYVRMKREHKELIGRFQKVFE